MKGNGMGWGAAMVLLGACLAGPGAAWAARIGVDPARFSLAYLRSDQTDWAWAASMEQILRYNGLVIKQEEIARRVYGTNPDGSTRTNAIEVVTGPGKQDVITTCMKKWTVDDSGQPFTAAPVYWQGVPSAQVLQAELSAQRPMLAMLRLPENEQYRAGANEVSMYIVIIEAGDYAPEPDGTPKFNSVEIRNPTATRRNPQDAGFVTLTPLEFKTRVVGYWTVRVTKGKK
jgi:hypothetical protein